MKLQYRINWIINGIYNKLGKIVNLLAYYCSLLAPLRKDLILFESQPEFDDNSLYLYKYLLSHNEKQKKLEWIGNSSINNSFPTAILNNRNGINPSTYSKIARAKFIFFSHNYPYFKLKKKNQTVIYMTHGCPIKKNKNIRVSNPSVDYIEKSNFDFALCIGNGAIEPQAIFCMCQRTKILPLGYPRNDELLSNIGSSSLNPFSDDKTSKLIIWMPTFRKSYYNALSENNSQCTFGLPLLHSIDEITSLNNILLNLNVKLLIKIHRLQAEYPIFREQFSNIIFITDETLKKYNVKLYSIIGYTDALLTDYSSVYFDYLLLDRPIAFTLDDYKEYEKDRGFVYKNTKAIMAGDHLYTFNDLKEWIMQISNGIDTHKAFRNKISKYFHTDSNVSSCARIKEYFSL